MISIARQREFSMHGVSMGYRDNSLTCDKPQKQFMLPQTCASYIAGVWLEQTPERGFGIQWAPPPPNPPLPQSSHFLTHLLPNLQSPPHSTTAHPRHVSSSKMNVPTPVDLLMSAGTQECFTDFTLLMLRRIDFFPFGGQDLY